MIRLAIIDDEPINRAYLESNARAVWTGPLTIDTFASPAELVAAGTGAATTHALVDLSFGSMDRAPTPILQTGVDAVDHLLASAPTCRIAMVTRFDGDPLMPEMVMAVRQTWPSVRFFHKSDGALMNRVVELLGAGAIDDNALFATTLVGQPQISIDALRRALLAGMYGRPGARSLRALSEWPLKPTAQQLARQLGVTPQYVRTVLQWCGGKLRELGVLGIYDEAGIDRLWMWARARQPILRRSFPEV